MPRKAEKHHKNLRLGGGCNQTMEEDDSDGFGEVSPTPNSPAPEQEEQQVLLQQSTPHDDDPHEDEEEEDEEDDEEEQEEEEDFHLEGQQLGLGSPGGSQQSLLLSEKLKTNGVISSNSKPTTSSKKSSKGNKGNRCQICRKKVGLTGFTCRCGGLFCALHRYSDKHECDFDYRKLGAEEIRKNNPVIEGEKIHKI